MPKSAESIFSVLAEIGQNLRKLQKLADSMRKMKKTDFSSKGSLGPQKRTVKKAVPRRQVRPKMSSKIVKRTMVLNGRTFEYSCRQSGRKSYGLSVSAGKLTISAPNSATVKSIEDVIRKKADWIEKAVVKSLHNQSIPKNLFWEKAWEHQEIQLVGLAEPTKIRFTSDKKVAGYNSTENIYFLYIADREVSKELFYQGVLSFVKSWSLSYLTDVTKKIAALDPYLVSRLARVKVSGAETRWGSCSTNGNINLNWRLALTEESLCEYVVIHELCHFYFMDHSPSYWRKVEEFCPDYKIRRKRLKEIRISDPTK